MLFPKHFSFCFLCPGKPMILAKFFLKTRYHFYYEGGKLTSHSMLTILYNVLLNTELTNIPDVGIHGSIGRRTLELQVTVGNRNFTWTIGEPGNVCRCTLDVIGISARRKKGNVLFNDALNTFYIQLYGV